MESQTLQEKIIEVRQNTISKSSKTIYINNIVRFLKYLHEKNRELLSAEFMEIEVTDINIKDFLKQAPRTPPIKFDQFSLENFFGYILLLGKSDGSSLSNSSYGSHRAALFHLFRMYNKKFTTEMDEELKEFFGGLKRLVAARIQTKNGRIKEGKDPLDFGLYEYLCKQLLKYSIKGDFIFTHTFLTISWNLMCRAKSAETIKLEHLDWKNDSLQIYFCTMKNDQSGEKPRHPRHIYSNPLNPSICPILSLGVYLLSFNFEKYDSSESSLNLFSGASQRDRYRKDLLKLLKLNEVVMELKSRGISEKDLGTHSVRKGASSYVASGTTAGPSGIAIALRAGWTLGGVEDRYLKYQPAGDMHVGRTVCGLPIEQKEFGILPPHFLEDYDITKYVKLCMPTIPESLLYVAKNCLASVVYHSRFLRETLPHNHRVFSSPLFSDRTIYDYLANKVVCGYSTNEDPMKPTGLTPNVSVCSRLHDLEEKVAELTSTIPRIAPQVVDGVINVLEERAIGAGTVTSNGLENTINKCLDKCGVFKLVDKIDQLGNPKSTERNKNLTSTALPFMNGDGRYSIVPSNFQFPDCGVLQAWQQWCRGDNLKKYPPFKFLKPCDMPTTNLRKRLCDFRFLFLYIENIAKEKGIAVETPTLEHCNNVFLSIESDIGLNDQEKRRFGQIKWSTAVNILRRKVGSLKKRKIND